MIWGHPEKPPLGDLYLPMACRPVLVAKLWLGVERQTFKPHLP